MKYSKHHFLASLFSISIFYVIFFLDLKNFFSYSDISFLIAICAYMVFVYIQRSTSKATFVMVLYFLLIMGISYLQNGFDTITERLGEWFFIFFVIGLIQYSRVLKETDI